MGVCSVMSTFATYVSGFVEMAAPERTRLALVRRGNNLRIFKTRGVNKRHMLLEAELSTPSYSGRRTSRIKKTSEGR